MSPGGWTSGVMALAPALSAGYADDVWSVALSSDGQWLASSGEDNRIKLWRLTVSVPSQH
jgi:WD40 repeat protein